jgi:tungstate transport system ATP-binding protein
MSSIFSINALQKSYAGRMILDLNRLEIFAGEILAIVGPSGAGKTTLLKLLNFLETPDSGTLKFKDQTAGPNLPLALRRQVTTVFQRPALLHNSVEKNVALGLRLRGNKDAHAQVSNVLDRMGLLQLRKSPAWTLSGGEAQRFALARAIVVQPAVLLLDEPTANLDPYNIELIEKEVREINRKEKTTIVLVTHNIFQAKRLADRIALLLNGQIIELAQTKSFFESPNDTRTRAFVNGEMIY